MGGHLVTGHVDGVGEVLSRVERDSSLELSIQAPPPVATFLVSKGAVAVDGVSLTINNPDGARFAVTLIPHTLAHTHLRDCRPGTPLNLEADILGKYVRHFLPGAAGPRLDEEFLAQHGFLPGREPDRR